MAILQDRFPDPKAMVKDLHAIGFKAIWMLDPGIKSEEGYFVYDSGSKNDIWIQKADGKPFVGKVFYVFYVEVIMIEAVGVSIHLLFLFVGEVWPGPCVFPDFTQEKARSWWAKLVKDFIANGVDGIWNDMNEPAVFKVSF